MTDMKVIELRTRIETFFAPTKHILEVVKAIDACRVDRFSTDSNINPINRIVSGPTLAGKTSIIDSYMRQNPPYNSADVNNQVKDIVPIIGFSSPHPFTLRAFYVKILRSLGTSVTTRTKLDEVKKLVVKQLKTHRVEVILVDDIQRLIYATYRKMDDAINVLTDISNLTNVSIIAFGLPIVEQMVLSSPQSIRRFPITRLSRFETCDKDFIEMLEETERLIDAPFSLRLTDESLRRPQMMFTGSLGLVGLYHNIIRETYSRLGIWKAETLSDIRSDADSIASSIKEACLAVNRVIPKNEYTRIKSSLDSLLV